MQNPVSNNGASAQSNSLIPIVAETPTQKQSTDHRSHQACPAWSIFGRAPNAEAIATGLKDIPTHWSLTPLQDKAPRRDGWESEPFIPHSRIADLILKGERKTSKKSGKEYVCFYSGVGVRTGEQSGGLVAIDIDGASADPLLQRMSGGDIPLTVAWTSGKPGRRQILFRVSDRVRPLVAGFGRGVVTAFEDLKTAPGEMLEIRYSNHQSALPPSRHPQTGSYKWLNSPVDTQVAIAPDWLCDLLIKFANNELDEFNRKQQQAEERQRQTEERRRERQTSTVGATTSLEDVLDESLKRLHAEDVYNWSGHSWHYQGNELQGCCPRHKSTSGKSFHVDTKTKQWFCFGCDVGGGAVQYRYFAQGGNGSPRGRDYVEVLRGLATDAGVTLPELSQSERDRNWGEPDEDAYREYLRQQEEQESAEEYSASFERERRQREWQERLQRKLNPLPGSYVWGQKQQEAPEPRTLWELGYKPSKIVHERYLNLEGIDTSFLSLVSHMGTGKTEALARLTADPNASLLIITNTVALAEALANRYNCRCYNEAELSLGETTRLAITFDSLWKIPTLNKRFTWLILDEADQTTTHAVNGSTCKRSRERILAALGYFVATAEHFILADADLSGVVIDWHSHLRGKTPYILKNTCKPCEGRTAYQFSSQQAAFEHGCQLLEMGQRVLFCTDAKSTVKKAGSRLAGTKTIEGIENLSEDVARDLEARFPDKTGRIVHGDNSGDPKTRNFIKNINSSLKYVPLDYLIYNSSMGSGVSIDVEAFDAVIVLAAGFTLPHTELGQLSHRYRPETEFCFWVNDDGKKNLETNCYRIAGDFLYKNQASGLSLRIDPDTGMTGVNNPEFLQLVASLEARRNWSLLNISAAFTAHLESMGYQVMPHPDEYLLTELDNVKEELKTHKKVVDAAERATICKAELLSAEQYETLKNKANPDFYERCSLQKYDLQEYYGVEVTEELIEKDDSGSLRRKLTRLDLLLNPETVARRMDLGDRRSHHVITDLRHYKLQRDLLMDLGLLEFIDPEEEYQDPDLTAIGERAKLKALDIKKILGLTIAVAPRYLRDIRGSAHRGIKAALNSKTDLAVKWLFITLASGHTPSLPEEGFADQTEADEYCAQLSTLGKLICEAVSIETRFRAREATNSQVHADLCDAVGLKRQKSRQTREGRFYRIEPASWEFCSGVLAHRQGQREQRLIEKERSLQLEAQRFQNVSACGMQDTIASEIAAVKQTEAPALVFLAETWIKFVDDRGEPETPLHPPAVYSKNDFLGGGATENKPVVPGAKAKLRPSALGRYPVCQLDYEVFTVEHQATGRTEDYSYHDYLQIRTTDGESYWIPAEWAESLAGLPVRRDPDSYAPRIPTASLRTWRNWLLGVRSRDELAQFERRRTPKELQAVVDSLDPDQLKTLQQCFQDWSITRDWLPTSAGGDTQLLEDINDWLQACVDLDDDKASQALSEALELMRDQDWFAASRQRVWNFLSSRLKSAIVRLSFTAYRILTVAS